MTGSAVPADEKDMNHSGTGRFSWLTMRPMSLYESGESNGKVSLAQLFETPEKILAVNKLKIEDLAFLICRGGWPFASMLQGEAALVQAFDYVDAVVKKDVSRVDGVNRNITTLRLLLRSYARNQGSQATIGTIVADMATNDENEVSVKTAGGYLEADGLCAGKGVLILPTLEEAKKEFKEMLGGMFGNNKPVRIDTIVVSTQHDEFVEAKDGNQKAADEEMLAKIREDVINIVIPRVLAEIKTESVKKLFDNNIYISQSLRLHTLSRIHYK